MFFKCQTRINPCLRKRWCYFEDIGNTDGGRMGERKTAGDGVEKMALHDFGWEGIWRKCSAIVCIYLSEIHIECEVHELFWEISNWKNEHCDTNSDWNSTWVLKTIAGQIIFSLHVYGTNHSLVWLFCRSRLENCSGSRRCSLSSIYSRLIGSTPELSFETPKRTFFLL